MGLLARLKARVRDFTRPVSYHSAFGDSGVRRKNERTGPSAEDEALRRIAEGKEQEKK